MLVLPFRPGLSVHGCWRVGRRGELLEQGVKACLLYLLCRVLLSLIVSIKDLWRCQMLWSAHGWCCFVEAEKGKKGKSLKLSCLLSA